MVSLVLGWRFVNVDGNMVIGVLVSWVMVGVNNFLRVVEKFLFIFRCFDVSLCIVDVIRRLVSFIVSCIINFFKF